MNISKELIVIIAYYFYPCDHVVLENVFAKEIGKVLPIFWLLRTQNKLKRKFVRWNYSQVRLIWAVKGSNILSKVINKLTSWLIVFSFLDFVRKRHVKIVLIRDMPVIALIIIILKKIHKSKVYYQSSAPQGEILKSSAILYKKFPINIITWIRGQLHTSASKCAIKNADIVFAITEYHKKILSYKREYKNIVPLTMGVDKDWIERRPNINTKMVKFKNEGNFIITYFGTLNFARNPLMLFNIFFEVVKIVENCVLLIMGKIESYENETKILKVCKDHGLLEKIIFTGQINRDNLQDHLRYCDLSISYIPVVDHYIISSPTKLYESLGNGVPVVGNKGIYEQDKVLKESGGGILVNEDVKSFSSAIIEMLNNKEMRNKMSESGKEYILKNYTYNKLASRILPYFVD